MPLVSLRGALLSALLVAIAFGGSYVLASGGDEPASPAALGRVAQPLKAEDGASLRTGRLSSAQDIPALSGRPARLAGNGDSPPAPAPAPAAAAPAPAPTPSPAPAPAPAPTPAPAPAPAPAPQPAPPDPGNSFDDSG